MTITILYDRWELEADYDGEGTVSSIKIIHWQGMERRINFDKMSLTRQNDIIELLNNEFEKMNYDHHLDQSEWNEYY
jgi:hypothetical protein